MCASRAETRLGHIDRCTHDHADIPLILLAQHRSSVLVSRTRRKSEELSVPANPSKPPISDARSGTSPGVCQMDSTQGVDGCSECVLGDHRRATDDEKQPMASRHCLLSSDRAQAQQDRQPHHDQRRQDDRDLEPFSPQLEVLAALLFGLLPFVFQALFQA